MQNLQSDNDGIHGEGKIYLIPFMRGNLELSRTSIQQNYSHASCHHDLVASKLWRIDSPLHPTSLQLCTKIVCVKLLLPLSASDLVLNPSNCVQPLTPQRLNPSCTLPNPPFEYLKPFSIHPLRF